jgi:LysM repeat protein
MKKISLALVTLMILIAVIFSTSDVLVFAKKIFLGDPTTHEIQNGEYLSMIAQKYYGDASLWRELSLINRAPDSDLVFPGEEIVLPRKDVLLRIRKTRRLSEVNRFVRGEEDIIARLRVDGDELAQMAAQETTPATEPESELIESETPVHEDAKLDEPVAVSSESAAITAEEDMEVSKSSSFPILIIAIAAAFVISLISLVIYRKKRNAKYITVVDDAEISGDKDESEPDYQDYLKSRKKRAKAEVLN